MLYRFCQSENRFQEQLVHRQAQVRCPIFDDLPGDTVEAVRSINIGCSHGGLQFPESWYVTGVHAVLGEVLSALTADALVHKVGSRLHVAILHGGKMLYPSTLCFCMCGGKPSRLNFDSRKRLCSALFAFWPTRKGTQALYRILGRGLDGGQRNLSKMGRNVLPDAPF